MKTKITVLVDNNTKSDLLAEWGLSFLIEHKNKKILFDAGKTSIFLRNLASLGYKVEDIDYAAISHAHDDHANGMEAFLINNKKAKLYMQESADENCYVNRIFFHDYIGIKKGLLSTFKDRIVKVSGKYKLCEDIYLLGHTSKDLWKNGKRDSMQVKTKEGYKWDDFSHEQSLIIDTNAGLVVLNSCSHSGILNIINEVKEAFPGKKVYALLGGFHMFNKTKSEILKTAKEINDNEIDKLYTGHCTKNRAFNLMQKTLGDKIEQFYSGFSIEI